MITHPLYASPLGFELSLIDRYGVLELQVLSKAGTKFRFMRLDYYPHDLFPIPGMPILKRDMLVKDLLEHLLSECAKDRPLVDRLFQARKEALEPLPKETMAALKTFLTPNPYGLELLDEGELSL